MLNGYVISISIPSLASFLTTGPGGNSSYIGFLGDIVMFYGVSVFRTERDGKPHR